MAAPFLAIKFSDFLRENLLKERSQWVLWTPVGIGIGILVYFGLQAEPLWWVGLSGVLFSSITLIFLRLLKIEKLKAYTLILISLMIFLGFTAAQLRTHSLETYLFNYPSRVQTIKGKIAKIEQLPKGLRLSLENVTLSPIKLRQPLARIRINFKGKMSQEAKDLVPGQEVQFKGVLLPPKEPVAPGAYDFRKKAFFEKISAVGYGLSSPHILKSREDQEFKNKILLNLTKVRHSLTSFLKTTIKGNSGAIAAALITGDRSGISEELREDFANSGLAHILAISGLHLSIVAGLAFLIFRKGLSFIPWLALRYPIKKWAAVFALILTFCYLVLCDFAIPAQRAFIMTAIILLAVLTDRIAITLRNVALAAIVILLFLPESIMSPSFQMSFSAVIALVSGYEILRHPLETWRSYCQRWWQLLLFYLMGIILSSILATIATTPYIAYTFNRFTVHSLAANIICIPLLSFIIMPSLILYLATCAFFDGGYLALFLHHTLCWMIEIAQTISLWPGSTLLVPSISPQSLLIFTLSFLWICLWKTFWRWGGVLGLVGAFVLASLQNKPDIFITGDKKLICILDSQGKGWVNSLQAGRFARENWLKMVALKESHKLSENNKENPPGIFITPKSYFISKNGKSVIIFKEPVEKEFLNNTEEGKILLFEENTSKSTNIITRGDFQSKGGHFIWLSKKGIKVRTVLDDVGNRPWSLKVKG